MNKHALAHISVQCCATSPCGKLVIFGTNFGSLILAPLDCFNCSKGDDDWKLMTLSIPNISYVYSLLTKTDYLFIGVSGAILVISWSSLKCCNGDFKTIRLKTDSTSVECPSVNSLTSLKDSGSVFAGCSNGYVYEINPGDFTVSGAFKCSQLPIHSLSSMDFNELLTCSEDGTACFWDLRESFENWKPTLTITPGLVPELQRPVLGNWLSVAAVQPSDSQWLVLGGGPKLALWNRRARKHAAVLEPMRQSSNWYPLVGQFVGAHSDPKIIAGGSSGSLVAWDHSGAQLFETVSSDDPLRRMTCILTAIELPKLEGDLSGSILVGGLSPYVHLVSRIGYPSKYVKLLSN